MKNYGFLLIFLLAGCTKEVTIDPANCNLDNAFLHGIDLTAVASVEGKVPECKVVTCDAGYAPASDAKSCTPSNTDIITYVADFSPYGACSADDACDGVGIQNRTISDCKKFRNGNFESSVNLSFCATVVSIGDLQSSCDSPAGNLIVGVANGQKTVSCLAGDTTQNFVSLVCNANFHQVGQSCVADVITYTPIYSSYGACSADEACEGSGIQSRTITQCNQFRNGNPDGTTTLSNCSSFAIAANLDQSCGSPAGNINTNITGGVQTYSCPMNSSTQTFVSVSCNSGFFINGQICSPDVITYSPTYSSYGICSADSACEGVGSQTRTITQCNQLRNGNPDGTTTLANCASFNVPANTTQSCNSPAGNINTNITGGVQTYSCPVGSQTQSFVSVSCNSGFFIDGQICSPDVITYSPVYSNYGACSADAACEGIGSQSRTITQCNQLRNGNADGTTTLSNCDSFAVSANLDQSCDSPAGNVLVTITGGEQTYSCPMGSTVQTFESVSCNFGFFIDGQICSPDVITYSPVYSNYGACSADSACEGQGIQNRTITQCNQLRNGNADGTTTLANCAAFDIILNTQQSCDSPQGNVQVSITGGEQTYSCPIGSTVQTFESVSCVFGFFIDGQICSPDVITYTPTYSNFGSCSADSACEGIGTQTRTITQCNQFRNGNADGTTALLNCAAYDITLNTEQSCDSPAGNIQVAITGGEQTRSCPMGSTAQTFVSVTCDSGFFISGEICEQDVITFSPNYSNFGSCDADAPCDGDGIQTRTINSCSRLVNGNLNGFGNLSDCAAFDIPVNTTQACQSPQGNVQVAITGGEQTYSCPIGSTVQTFESVSCVFGFFIDGQICSPDVITYTPTYSNYGACSADSACDGQGLETRTITQCNQFRNGNADGTTALLNCDSFATPANLEQSCDSPQGNIQVAITGGEQTYSCPIGSTVQTFESVSCVFGFFIDGQICSPDVITYSPVYSNFGGCSAQVCDGSGIETRTITQCNQLRNGNADGTTILSNCDSFATPTNLEQSCASPAGNILVTITGGEQTFSCDAGSSLQNFVSVSCEPDYHILGQICEADLITYSPIFSPYGACSADEACEGMGLETRTLTTCEKYRDGNFDSIVTNSFCAAYEIPAYLDQACSSPAGDKLNLITGGEITVNCVSGSDVENFVSMICYSAFQQPFNQNSCVDIAPTVTAFRINEIFPNSTPTYTNNITLSLNTAGATNVQTMKVFENIDCSGVPSLDTVYTENLSFAILTGDGTKNISIIYSNGTESSTCLTQSIILDTQLPTGTATFATTIGVEDEVPTITLTEGDSLSGVNYKTISVGTSLGSDEIVPEFNTGSNLTVNPTQLNGQMVGTLLPSTNYFITLKVYDNAGNVLVVDAGTFTYILPPPQLFFGAIDSGGNELWSYDGTTALRIANIRSGSSGSNPSYFAKFKNKVYFSANNGVNGDELWHWTGSVVNQIADIYASGTLGSGPKEMLVYKGKLYFSALDGVNGTELWSYDGTTTSLFYDFFVGGSGLPKNLFIFNNLLYFSATNGTQGEELWVYDGVNFPTQVVDISPGSTSSFPLGFVEYNNQMYFSAADASFGTEVFRYNGGSSVTRLSNINTGGNSNPTYMTVFNNKLYFAANSGNSGANTGNELWVYDGTTISLVADINTGTVSSNPSYLKVYDNKLYFAATTAAVGTELWVYDGVNPPTVANDVSSGAASGAVKDLKVFDGKLVFSATDGTGVVLWKFDGTVYSKVCTTCGSPTFIFPIY